MERIFRFVRISQNPRLYVMFSLNEPVFSTIDNSSNLTIQGRAFDIIASANFMYLNRDCDLSW